MICACAALWTASHAVAAQAHATLLETEPPASGRLRRMLPGRSFWPLMNGWNSIFNSIPGILDQDRKACRCWRPSCRRSGRYFGNRSEGSWKGPIHSSLASQFSGWAPGSRPFRIWRENTPPTEAAMNNLSAPQQSVSLKLLLLLVKWAGLAAMVMWLGGISFWITIFGPCIPVGWRN